MRKSTLILSFALLAAMSAGARQLSPAEALGRALGQTGVSRSAAPVAVPVMTVGSADSPSIYVFNNADKGFMVVSADDVAAPVIGYSDNGTFDPENMPENLLGWLELCGEEIAQASAAGVEPYRVSRSDDREPIAPLMATIWDQTSPFNRDCPRQNGFLTPTGCVATAMAQVMKYHNWPEQAAADAVLSYKWGQTQLTADFSNYRFDWANMLDTYRKGYTEEQASAVSKLMQACGYSVKMSYASSASGAVCELVGGALANYFKYDRSLHNEPRALYSADVWEELIYNDLRTNGPIVYWGGIHCFVCDGYSSDGYFHFNWGWSGSGDGYFRLNALNPNSVGTGGSTDGYNSNQGALLGVRPAGGLPSEPIYTFYSTGIKSTRTMGTYLYVDCEFKNYSPFTVSAQRVYSVYSEDGSKHIGSFPRTPTSTGNSIDFAPDLRDINTYGPLPTANVPEGTYRVYPAVIVDGKEYLFRCPSSEAEYVIYTRAKSGYQWVNTSTLPDVGKKVIEDLSTNGDFYIDKRIKISGTAKFTGNADASLMVECRLLKTDGSEVAKAGTATIEFTPEGNHFEFISLWFTDMTGAIVPGDYIFALSYVEVTSNQYVNIASCPVTVHANANPECTITGLTVENASAVDPSAIHMTADVTGEISVSYQDLFFEILTPDNLTKVWTGRAPLYVSAGQSTTVSITASIPDAKPGEKYNACVYKVIKYVPTYGPIIPITIGDTSGIESVEVPDNAPVEYFNLQGVRVDSSNLVPGIYIRRQGDKVTKVRL